MIFNFDNYRDYISWQKEQNVDIRGYQSKLAEAAGCQRSVFSQILSGKHDLNMEQGSRLADYWKLTENEAEYFICLILRDRSSDTGLNKRWNKKLKTLREENEVLENRYRPTSQINLDSASTFYSSYIWALVYTALSIPQYKSISELSKRLCIDKETIRETLSGLQEMGLIEKKSNRWETTNNHIFLPKNSPMISMHHSNWQTKALNDTQLRKKESLHYSGVMAISNSDFQKIKRILIRSIDKQREITESSREEDLFCLVLDFFRVV